MSSPLQVYLDDADLERWVRQRGWTKSHAVRVAIRALTREADEDPLLAASGMVEGLPEDLSERIDRYLEDTFVAETAPRYAGSGGRKKRRIRR